MARGLLLKTGPAPTGGGLAPVNLTLPVMSGTGQEGQAIDWTNGTWSGDLPMTFAYKLNRDGVLYLNSPAKPYTCLTADISKQLTVDVTATNAIGSATARNVIPLFGIYRTTLSGAPPVLVRAGTGNNNREINHAHYAPDGSGRIVYTRYNIFNGDGTPNPPNTATEGADYRNTEIVMWNENTQVETVLVPANPADVNANPVWWPDSSKIMFIRKIGTGISSIGQYAFSNNQVSNLYTSPDINMSDPHVASDGSFICMSGATSVGGQPRSHLYIYKIATGVRTQLTSRVFPNTTSGAPGYFDNHINPARTKIAATVLMSQGVFQIIVISISATQTNLGELVIPQFGSPLAFVGVPEWAPDGSDKIVFWYTNPESRDTNGDYYMNADGSGRTRIPLPPQFNYNTVAFQPGGGSMSSSPILFSAQGTLPIYQAKPVALTPPTVTGTAQDGQILHATVGTYANGTNLGFSRQWKADAVLAIGPGATTLDYTQVPMDVGHRMTIEEQGKNSGGWSAPNISAPTAIVIAEASGGTGAPYPGQVGNLVGHTHAPMYPGFLTPMSINGPFVNGTPGNPTIYSFKDFDGGMNGLFADASKQYIKFVGCRFQSNSQNSSNISMAGAVGIDGDWCTISPRVALVTAPPNPAWPSSGAGLDEVADKIQPESLAHQIPWQSCYQYGLNFSTAGNGGPFTWTNCDIWGGQNMIAFYSTLPAIEVRNCWIHDLGDQKTLDPKTSYHQDGPGYLNSAQGPSNLKIIHCTIASIGNGNALAFQGGSPFSADLTEISDNFISGFQVPLFLSGVKRTMFRDNVLGTDLPYGITPVHNDYTALFHSNGNLWSNNKLRILAGTAPHAGSSPQWTVGQDGFFLWPDGTFHAADFV